MQRRYGQYQAEGQYEELQSYVDSHNQNQAIIQADYECEFWLTIRTTVDDIMSFDREGTEQLIAWLQMRLDRFKPVGNHN